LKINFDTLYTNKVNKVINNYGSKFHYSYLRHRVVVNCFHFYFFLDIQGDFESGPDILTSGRNHFKKSLGATVFYEKMG
jgi:hypothetical protein